MKCTDIPGQSRGKKLGLSGSWHLFPSKQAGLRVEVGGFLASSLLHTTPRVGGFILVCHV